MGFISRGARMLSSSWSVVHDSSCSCQRCWRARLHPGASGAASSQLRAIRSPGWMVSSAGSALARCSRTTTSPTPAQLGHDLDLVAEVHLGDDLGGGRVGCSRRRLRPTATMRSGRIPTRTRVPRAALPRPRTTIARAGVNGETAVGRLDDLAGQEVHVPDEVSHERRQRPVVDRARLVDLLDHAVGHDRDPVRHGQRLTLVVGDVDEGDADLVLDALELDLHLLAELQVERAQRLVQQQHPRVHHQRPGQRDALLLAAGEHAWAGASPGRSSAPVRAPRRALA